MRFNFVVIFLLTILTIGVFKNTTHADYYNNYQKLSYGLKNSNVYDLQKDLKKIGFLNAKLSGFFGNQTYNAVCDFQRTNDLAVTGQIDYTTAKKIKILNVIQTAKGFLGIPYVWGGVTPRGFDCSGFTHYTFLKNNIVIPRTAAQQCKKGLWVSKNNLSSGDLIFFSTYKPGPSHVGLYLGNNNLMHASSGWNKLVIVKLSNRYFANHYYTSKRIIV